MLDRVVNTPAGTSNPGPADRPLAAGDYDEHRLEALAREQYATGDAGFPIAWRTSALILIDMQLEFASQLGGPYFVPEARRRIPAMTRLLDAFRERERPVVHTAFGATNGFFDRPRTGGAMPSRAAGELFDDSGLFCQAVFVAPLQPRDGEIVLLKPSYGAFYDTPLETILRRLGVETVVLAGTLTDVCVSTTARQAYERSFGVVVAADATATSLPEIQEAELQILRRSFARVLNVATVLAELAAG